MPGDSPLRYASMPGDDPEATITLRTYPEAEAAVATLQEGFAAAASAYPVFRRMPERRVKLSYLVLLLFVTQELFFSGLRRAPRRIYFPLRALTLPGWLVFTAIMWTVYLS